MQIPLKKWVWAVGFVIILVLAWSLSSLVLVRPKIYSQVGNIDIFMTVNDQRTDSSEYSLSDILRTFVKYTDAKPMTRIDIAFARMDGKSVNGRTVLIQNEYDLSGSGEKFATFPAFERIAGSYEVAVFHEGEFIYRKKFNLRNE